MYAVVLDAKEDKELKARVLTVAFIDSNLSNCNCGVFTDELLISNVGWNGNGSIKSINFDISDKDGAPKIVEGAGSFKRLAVQNGVSPRVVLAVYVSQTGRTLGYVVMDKNGVVSRVKKDVLLSACAKAQERGVAFLQNGIYRVTNGVPMIASYPGHDFVEIVQQLKKKMPEPKIAEHIVKKPKEEKAVKTEKAVKPAKTDKSAADKPAKAEKPMKNSERYSDEQKREIIAAKKNGVDPMIVSNPKLTPEQMRIIWTAKKNKRASEYFANPKFSVEQMQFFADRLVDRQTFNECKGIINPKYNIDQLGELYLGICDGIDYTQYADEKLSAEDMYIKRNELTCKTYASILVGKASAKDSQAFLRRISVDKK